jgi:hypothetical protein
MNIIFKKISIIDRTNKKGFSEEFSPGVNFIHGENDTGKSSLIKALYYTLGADLRLDDEWKILNVTSCLDIEYGSKKLTFIRSKKQISVFNTQNPNEMLFNDFSIGALTPFISKIFNFNLELLHKSSKELVQATPAFLYLPFYIDQDDGWKDIFKSFKGLLQYEDYILSSLQYHSGLKSHTYYKKNAERRNLIKEQQALMDELKIIQKSMKKFQDNFNSILFDLDIEHYEKLLETFLDKCNKLELSERKYRLKLIDLMSKRESMTAEIEEYKDAINDFRLLDSETASNDIISDYQSANSKENLVAAIPELYEEKEKLNKTISLLKEELYKSKRVSTELKEMLSEVKGEITLRDVISSEANKNVLETFLSQIEEIETEIGKLEVKIRSLEDDIKGLSDKNKSTQINKTFKNALSSIAIKINLKNPVLAPLVQHVKITKGKTGSRSPRAIFAYYFALWKTILEHTSTPFFPLVIDSPRQQDLDVKNTRKLIDALLKEFNNGTQIIVGSVPFDETLKGDKEIILTKEFSLLQSDEYDKSWSKISPYFNTIYS